MRNMTTVRRQIPSERPATNAHVDVGTQVDTTHVIRMGSWYFTPPCGAEAHATLRDHFHSVDLRYSAEPVQDLLVRLARIETSYMAAVGLRPDQDTPVYGGPWQYRRA
ncbi:hypothetical protein [Streptomyces sp. NPDC046939]|uniref:hypothetical protein n=1 Tax=Streptomyces sp. NPDC046939 TaxID=3155376 RepID=UPI003408E34D